MNSKLWIRKAVTMSLTVAIFAAYSMVALAGDGRTAGEIVITGNTGTGAVTVNGEPAKSGRTIFSSSTISTPEDAGAIINLGKAGKIELAPNTTFSVNFDDKAITGSLTTGSVSVLNAVDSVGVTTLSGDVVKLNAGESASASSSSSTPKPAPTNHTNLWPYLLVLGGAIVLIVVAVAKDNNTQLGGGVITISPNR